MVGCLAARLLGFQNGMAVREGYYPEGRLLRKRMNSRFVLAYSLNGKVYLKPRGGRVGTVAEGVAPAISPSQERVAFLKQGDVFLYSQRLGGTKQLTNIRTSFMQQSFFPLSVAWHPEEECLLFTRVEPYIYDEQTRRLIEYRRTSPSKDAVGIMTVWIVHLKSGRCQRMFGPFGDITALHRSNQLEGASVYEPVFSPDGRWVWVLHRGNLYEAEFDRRGGAVGTPRFSRQLGTGFDLESLGASKAGHGALMLAWDSRSNRLVYWVGRFWGTGVSEYGYLSWQHGQLGKPREWQPPFAKVLRQWGAENISGCVFDRRGNLWVRAVQGESNVRWIRADGREALPVGAGRPSF